MAKLVRVNKRHVSGGSAAFDIFVCNSLVGQKYAAAKYLCTQVMWILYQHANKGYSAAASQHEKIMNKYAQCARGHLASAGDINHGTESAVWIDYCFNTRACSGIYPTATEHM